LAGTSRAAAAEYSSSCGGGIPFVGRVERRNGLEVIIGKKHQQRALQVCLAFSASDATHTVVLQTQVTTGSAVCQRRLAAPCASDDWQRPVPACQPGAWAHT
jgi:hypothetical protein